MLFKKQIHWYKIFESAAALESFVKEGQLNSIQIGNKKICIAHTPSGYFAINDKCPHNGASLSNGYCTSENSIVCPVHRYHFDLKTGRAKSGGGDCADTYPIDIKEQGVYIGLMETAWKLF
jgi:nitrite reductase/ring-hydroxylating ferredoxin subunit